MAPSPASSAIRDDRTPAEDSIVSLPVEAQPRSELHASIYDYGVIGDLRTAALVSRTGSIDWACFPRFSGPSVFGRLLDRERGGYHRVHPLDAAEATQRYLPGTNVLRTHFVHADGRSLTLTDFMPIDRERIGEGDPSIFRIVEAEGGPVRVSIRVEPQFDYGRGAPALWESDSNGLARATADGSEIWCRSPWPWTISGSHASAEGQVEPGRAETVAVGWGDGVISSPSDRLLHGTIRYWRSWVHGPDSPMHRAAHVWYDWVERSELLLKLLSHGDTGAFIAAPTTSLPEWPGGPRNWDYRYVWVRDAAFAAQAFLLLGHLREAKAYVRWVVECLSASGPGALLATVYDVAGKPPTTELELDHWTGYDGSRPVRIGNAAASQTQLDIFGEVLDAVGQLAPVDPEFVRSHWPLLVRLAERAVRSWKRPDSGIWESRTRRAHYVHSKVMCWVAVDRAARIAEQFGEDRKAARWREAADLIHATVLKQGYHEGLGTFVQAFDRPSLDASVLRIPMTGFLPYDDSRVQSTIRTVEKRLAKGPFVYRYHSAGSQHGPEGAFLLCSFWLVECLARGGSPERAVRNFRQLLKAAGPLRLFAEEFDPIRRAPTGNYPQAFTHIGLLRAALAIGARRPARAPDPDAPSGLAGQSPELGPR